MAFERIYRAATSVRTDAGNLDPAVLMGLMQADGMDADEMAETLRKAGIVEGLVSEFRAKRIDEATRQAQTKARR